MTHMHTQSPSQVVASVVCLPYELEREIFELAAESFPGAAVKLAVVSSYVQEWYVARPAALSKPKRLPNKQDRAIHI